MSNINNEKYLAQKKWIVNICNEIVSMSETIDSWTIEKEHPRWKIAFRKKDGSVLLYKSGKYTSIRIDLQLIMYGLKTELL